MYSMKMPYSKKQISDAIIQTVRKSTMKECYIRPIAYYSYGMLGLTPTANKIDVAIACVEALQEYTKAGKIRGTRCKVSRWLRIDSRSQPMQAKAASNYANAALARVEALSDGYDESIMLNYDNKVAEGSAENIFLVNDGKIITPPLSAGILPGITRDSVIKIAEAEKLFITEKNCSIKELFAADEVFMTGTASEIKPVTEVNDKAIGDGNPGRVTLKLHKIFMDVVSGKDRRFSKWLTPI
jgi:branched-chain amino acid aminotransferase